jgi:hypothetical protein
MNGKIRAYILHTGTLRSEFALKDNPVNKWARLLQTVIKTVTHFPQTTLNLICDIPASDL